MRSSHDYLVCLIFVMALFLLGNVRNNINNTREIIITSPTIFLTSCDPVSSTGISTELTVGVSWTEGSAVESKNVEGVEMDAKNGCDGSVNSKDRLMFNILVSVSSIDS